MGTILLPYGHKSPPPRGFTGHDGFEPDDEQVAAWMAEGGNIGIRFPMGVVGIDVDWYKNDGQVSWSNLLSQCGALPPTWKSSARPTQPHSGVYLFRIPWELKLHDKPAPGIEIIQWFHRYMCTWPSIHPEGGKYLLTSPDGKMGFGPPLIEDLPELPETWLKRLMLVERPEGIAKPKMVTGTWANSVTKIYAETMTALNMQGGRHDSMRDGANGLVRLASMSYPGAQEALDMLGHLFVAQVSSDGTRSHAEAYSELQRILRGAEELVATTGSYRPSWDQLERPRNDHGGVVPSPSPMSLDPEDSGWGFADLREHIETGLSPEVASLLARSDGACLIYLGKVNTLFGQSGSGKTWVGLLIIAQEIKQGHKALYVDWEDDVRTFLRRLINLGCDPADVIEYAEYVSPRAPASPSVIQWLVDQGFAVVVMDSTGEGIAAQGGLSQNDDGDVATWMRALPRPLAWSGAAVVLIDHVPKATPEGGAIQEIGSQRKRAAVSGASYEVIQTEPFSKQQAGRLILRTGKDRGGNWARGQVVAECRMMPVGDDGDMIIEVGVPMWVDTNGDLVRPTIIMERVSVYIENNPGATVRDIQAVRGKKTIISQALEILKDEGFVAVKKVGNRFEHTSERPYREASDPVLQPPEALE